MNKKTIRAVKIICGLIGLTGIGLCLLWFGWKLALILFLVIWGNNAQRQNFNK
jgi:uncharacterized membrane protein